MNLMDKLKQGYQKAHNDKELILNEIHSRLETANYYDAKYLKETKLFIGIEYPLQIVSRSIGKSYWDLGNQK